MRRADDVRQADQVHVFRGLLFKDVQRGPGHLSRDDGVVEVLFVDDPAAGAVDDENALFHFGEGVLVDDAPGFLGHGRVDGDEVGVLQQVVQADEADPDLLGRFRRDEGVVGNDVHLQPLRPVGDDGSHAADPDDAQRLVEELVPHEFVLFPFARLHGGRRLGDFPGQGEHHGDGVLARGDRVAAGGVHDDDPPLARGGDVHVVEAGAGPPDDLQVFGAVDDPLRHLGGAADHQAVILLDDAFQFVRGEVRHDVHLDPRRVFQYLDPFGGQGVADQYLFHAMDLLHKVSFTIPTLSGGIPFPAR